MVASNIKAPLQQVTANTTSSTKFDPKGCASVTASAPQPPSKLFRHLVHDCKTELTPTPLCSPKSWKSFNVNWLGQNLAYGFITSCPLPILPCSVVVTINSGIFLGEPAISWTSFRLVKLPPRYYSAQSSKAGIAYYFPRKQNLANAAFSMHSLQRATSNHIVLDAIVSIKWKDSGASIIARLSLF
jgi:hypothetical protein